MSGGCVACRTDTQATDCASATPICGNSNTCRPCRAHAECGSGVCKSDGTCAAATDVAYVNNASAACRDMVHVSTPAIPYCQIQFAATMAAKPYVVVAGSGTAYNAISLATTAGAGVGPLTIVGPGRAATPTAKVAQAGLAAVSIDVSTAQTLTLTLDGLARRDRMVLSACRDFGVPFVITLGGGYSDPIEVTAEAHANTFFLAAEIFG